MYSYDFEKTTQPKASKENKGMQDYLKLFNNRKTRNNIKQHGILSSGKGGFSNSNPLYSSENNDILKISKNGENDVIEIQDGLDLAGFTNADGTRIKKDGIFGAKTQDAYNKFWNKAYPAEPNYLKNSSKWFQNLSSSNAINNDNEAVKASTPRISGATAAAIAGINAAKAKLQKVSAGTSAAIAGASAAAKPIPQSGSAAVAGTAAGAKAIAPQQPFGEANAENLLPTPIKMPNTDLNDDIFYYWMKKTGIPQFNLQLNPDDTETEDYLEGLKSIDKNLAYREKPKELLSTIQTALTRFGYTGKDGKPLTGDGIYDENTASALSEFLEDEGIEDSENMWERIQKSAHSVFDSVLDGVKRQDETNRLQADSLYKGAQIAGEKIGDTLGNLGKGLLGNALHYFLDYSPTLKEVTPETAKNAERNFEHNKKLDEKNISSGLMGPGIYINGQGREEYKDYMFGNKGDGEGNGCGPIAIYNVLTALGEYMPLSEIEHEITRTGNALKDGNWGANPACIDNFLKKKGYDVEMNYFPKTTEMEEEVKNGDTCILLFGYIDDKGNLGAHYVTINYDENSDKPFQIFNAGNDDIEKLNVSEINEYIKSDTPIATYTVRRK